MTPLRSGASWLRTSDAPRSRPQAKCLTTIGDGVGGCDGGTADEIGPACDDPRACLTEAVAGWVSAGTGPKHARSIAEIRNVRKVVPLYRKRRYADWAIVGAPNSADWRPRLYKSKALRYVIFSSVSSSRSSSSRIRSAAAGSQQG